MKNWIFNNSILGASKEQEKILYTKHDTKHDTKQDLERLKRLFGEYINMELNMAICKYIF